MASALRLVLGVIAAGTLSACSVSSGLARAIGRLASSDRPVAFAQFDGNRVPIPPGSRGAMFGFIPVTEPGSTTRGPHDARFTYLIDLRVTSSRDFGRQLEGHGTRRVFFNPGGANASFADPITFTHGREVESDMVRFSGDYTPEDMRIRLHFRICDTTPEPVSFNGRTVVTPANEPLIFRGRYRENFGAWEMSASPTAF